LTGVLEIILHAIPEKTEDVWEMNFFCFFIQRIYGAALEVLVMKNQLTLTHTIEMCELWVYGPPHFFWNSRVTLTTEKRFLEVLVYFSEFH
jgi:hypothetical protein